MKCPHCLTSFHDEIQNIALGEDTTSRWTLKRWTCPTCKKFIIAIYEEFNRIDLQGLTAKVNQYKNNREFLCYPKAVNRVTLGPEVPQNFANDYREACLTLPYS